MSHPKRKDLFDAWYKAMIAGAIVDKPNYGKTMMNRRNKRRTAKPWRRASRKSRNAKKD